MDCDPGDYSGRRNFADFIIDLWGGCTPGMFLSGECDQGSSGGGSGTDIMCKCCTALQGGCATGVYMGELTDDLMERCLEEMMNSCDSPLSDECCPTDVGDVQIGF